MKKYRKGGFACLMSIVMLAAMVTGCGSSATAGEETQNNIDPLKYVTLGEYKGIAIEAADTTVSDADIENRINSDLGSHSEMKEVTGRAAKMGDVVNIDYVGTKDGVAFDGGTGNYDLELGSGSFIPGFEDGVVGMNVGDEKDLDLTFPENYHSEELAGADVVFNVKVNSISEKAVPELTDELVQSLGVDAKTVEEYKENIKKELTEERESSAEANQKSDLLKTVMDNTKCDIDSLPEWLVSEKAGEFKSSTEAFVTQYGMTMDDYLKQMGSDQAAFDKEALDYGKEQAKTELVVLAISNAENLEVTDKDMEDYYQEYAKTYNTTADQLKKSIPRDELKSYLLREKVMDFIYDNAVTK
ncbi:MAG: trigger factor [Lachnospiraceae bacterium]|nr:trigger factor [Lachnospiraceae bacterium]